MRVFILAIATILFVQTSNAQSFIEICPTDALNGTVVNYGEFNDTLYGTGFFDQICGESANYLTKWNGVDWDPTNISLPNEGHALTAIGADLFISSYVNSVDSNWVYRYDGSTLSTFGTGVYLTTATNFSNLANIYDVAEFNSQMYVCGEFDKVGDQSISGIMRWNGSDWESVGGGLSGNIASGPPIMYPHQMIVHDNELYVVGNFRYADGVEVNGVAKWDGSSWSAMGSGFNSTVYGIGVYSNEVWVGGDFTTSGAQPLNRIAKWNGTDWESPGFGFVNQSPSDYTFVHTFLEADGGLYISGGIKEIYMDIGTTINCGGIIHYSPFGINTFNGGVSGNDIEAIGKTQANQLIIGGGVFGNGYTGILDQFSGQSELKLEQSAVLYPNPGREIVTIESNFHIQAIQIINLKGELIHEESQTNTLNVATLQSGIYFVKVITDAGIEVIKLNK